MDWFMSTVTELPQQPQILMRVTEVAKQLNLSRSCVYQIMDRGELPYVKIGKSRRVKPDAVAQLIEAGTVGGK
jgi:excisionase family DNA binding protein